MPDVLTSATAADTHEMDVIHRAFRRESQLLGELITAVPDGDTGRAALLSRHLAWYRAGLTNHHHGEDELLWPLLRQRAEVGAEIVVRMERQHARVADSLADVLGVLPAWQASAATGRRDELVTALDAQLLVQAREAGVVEERQRLAGEIHDTLAQGLAGIVAQLEAAEQARGRQVELSRHLTQARALARSSLTEARRSVRALRPEQLERASLPEAIDQLSRAWSARSAVPVDVETTGAPTPLDPAIEAAIFRASQEALSNIAKHAAASRVHLTLTYLHDALLLDVADNGTGFDPAARTHGYGLIGMRQRLAGIAGHLTVESAPGAGTTLNAAVPLAKRQHVLAPHSPADARQVRATR